MCENTHVTGDYVRTHACGGDSFSLDLKKAYKGSVIFNKAIVKSQGFLERISLYSVSISIQNMSFIESVY